jgi:hypothetical protein
MPMCTAVLAAALLSGPTGTAAEPHPAVKEPLSPGKQIAALAMAHPEEPDFVASKSLELLNKGAKVGPYMSPMDDEKADAAQQGNGQAANAQPGNGQAANAQPGNSRAASGQPGTGPGGYFNQPNNTQGGFMRPGNGQGTSGRPGTGPGGYFNQPNNTPGGFMRPGNGQGGYYSQPSNAQGFMQPSNGQGANAQPGNGQAGAPSIYRQPNNGQAAGSQPGNAGSGNMPTSKGQGDSSPADVFLHPSAQKPTVAKMSGKDLSSQPASSQTDDSDSYPGAWAWPNKNNKNKGDFWGPNWN